MGTRSSANARRSAMIGLLVLRPRGWIAIATVALVLLLPIALTLAQDAEETIDEEARPRDRVVGEAGYAYQGKADIDGGCAPQKFHPHGSGHHVLQQRQ
jgi:hypothetical protein